MKTIQKLINKISPANQKFWLIIIAIILICSAIGAIKYKEEIFQTTDLVAVGKAYGESQYVLGNDAINKIDDSALYTYAASAYFKGDDPATINFEHPPLGKYVFGLSIFFFNKVLVLNLALYAIALLLFAALLKQQGFSNKFIYASVIYLALFNSLDKHLRTLLLDTQILIWTLSFFLILFTKNETWKKYIGLGFILGAFISTKYFFPIIFLFIALLAIWGLFFKQWLKILVSIIACGAIYLISYSSYFLHQHNLLDFIKFEWYRFKWWTGNRTIPKFILLETIFLGKYRMWWENSKNYQADGDWNITWPILFVTQFLALIKLKLEPQKIIVIFYSIGLLAIYLFGSAVYGRYLLQLIPFWIIIIGWAIQRKSSIIKN